jgi:hypothetical protein
MNQWATWKIKFLRRHLALLLSDVCPDFIDLEALAWKLAHAFAHELSAARSYRYGD